MDPRQKPNTHGAAGREESYRVSQDARLMLTMSAHNLSTAILRAGVVQKLFPTAANQWGLNYISPWDSSDCRGCFITLAQLDSEF